MLPDALAQAKEVRTVIDANEFRSADDAAYVKSLFIPGIRRLGGIEAIAAVAANGPIWFHNVGEQFDGSWAEQAGRINGVEVRITKERADAKAIAEWLAKDR
jgi:hypothetical protein